MAVPEAIQKLVEKYTFHRDAYLRGQEKYNETQKSARTLPIRSSAP